MEGKEVSVGKPVIDMEGGAGLGARRVWGVSVKVFLIAGFLLLLLVIGGVVGGIIGGRKASKAVLGDEAIGTLSSTHQNSLIPSSTSVSSTATGSSTNKAGSPSPTGPLVTESTLASSSSTNKAGSPSPTGPLVTESTLASSSTMPDSSIASTTSAPVTTSGASDSTTATAESPSSLTTSSVDTTSTIYQVTSVTTYDSSTSSTSSPLPDLFSPDTFYTFQPGHTTGTTSYICAVDQGTTPGNYSLKPCPQSGGTLALESQWQILAVPASSARASYGPVGADKVVQTYWMSNRYYGPDRPLTLSAEDWADKDTAPLLQFPPKGPKDDDNEGQYWVLERAGSVYYMYNVKSWTDFEAVLMSDGSVGLAN